VKGTKKSFSKDDYKHIEVTKYPELSTEFALNQAKEDANVMLYLPAHWLRPKQKIDREFLWGAMHTVNPDFVK
jgi:hypothetical protein